MSNQRRTKLMVVSSALLAVAPKCPICFLAYFGIFGVATTSASVYRVWLAPLTAIWLALTVGVLAVQSSGRRRYGPAVLGLFAGVAVFSGKFILDEQVLVHLGIAVLIGAAAWRVWHRTSTSSELCQQCDNRFPLDTELGKKKPTEV